MSEPEAQPINARTAYCAVFGFPVRHSASPAMQNAGIAALGLNWRYLAFEVRPEQLRVALEGAKAMHFAGVNLTVPHKLLALGMVDELDASATRWGAVNTVRFEGQDENGVWQPLTAFKDAPPMVRSHGFNTDADAFARSIREDLAMDLAGAKVLLLGAGGAGQTAALKLASEGIRRLYLVNRTLSKAQEAAEKVRQAYPGAEVQIGYPEETMDLVVNATSLGLKPADPPPLDEKVFPLNRAGHVYDMVYVPAETPLLKAARAAGCRTANGLGMLLYQGARALEIWTGRSAPVERMREALKRHVYGSV